MRRYDRRSSSLMGDLAFFIEPTFWASRRAGADDPDGIVLIGVGHGEEPPSIRQTKCDPAILADRVIGIGAGDGERIRERGRRLLERDRVLSKIRCRLPRIPGDAHREIVRRGRLR